MQLIEEDDAGNVTAIYDDGSSSSGGSGLSEMRTDIIVRDEPELCPRSNLGQHQVRHAEISDQVSKKKGKSRWQDLANVFLPAGYPHSVTDDYLEYQIYVCFLRSTQEFSRRHRTLFSFSLFRYLTDEIFLVLSGFIASFCKLDRWIAVLESRVARSLLMIFHFYFIYPIEMALRRRTVDGYGPG